MKTFTTLLILFAVSASLFLTFSPQQAKAGSDIAPDKIENTVATVLQTETLDGDPPFSIVNGRLVANGDSEEEKTLVSKFNNIQDDNLRTTTLGYIGEVLADTSLSDLRKRVIVGAFMNTALGNDNVAYRNENANIDPKYRANLTKIEEMAGGDGEIGIDETNYDYLFESNTEDDLERAEEELRQSEKELRQSEATLKAKIDELETEIEKGKQLDEDIEAQEEELQRLKGELEKLQGGND